MDLPSPSAESGSNAAVGARDEEELADDPILLQKLVLDVKPELLLQDDDCPTKSTGALAEAQPHGSLADEPSYECSVHQKIRKERFLQQDPQSGTWSCREGCTCKSSSGETRKKRSGHSNTNGDSHMSVGSNHNHNSTSQGGLGSSQRGYSASPSASFGPQSGSQHQNVYVCAVHKKVRSARNLSFTNGAWVCLPHSQCQLTTGDRMGFSNPNIPDERGPASPAATTQPAQRMPPPYVAVAAPQGPHPVQLQQQAPPPHQQQLPPQQQHLPMSMQQQQQQQPLPSHPQPVYVMLSPQQTQFVPNAAAAFSPPPHTAAPTYTLLGPQLVQDPSTGQFVYVSQGVSPVQYTQPQPVMQPAAPPLAMLDAAGNVVWLQQV